MRENGLRAAAYVAVIDLHPQVADVMLEALAAAGVAAYAAPVSSPRGILLPTQFPTGPLDRLFVDRDAYDAARRVLDVHLPTARAELEPTPVEASARTAAGEDASGAEPPASTHELVDDDTWGRIVATFHGAALERPSTELRDGEPTTTAPTEPTRAWPESEDLGVGGSDEPVLRTQDGAPGPTPTGLARGDRDGDEPDRYEPPLPPPLPLADQTTRLAWAGVIGGPVLFILTLLLDWELASWAQLAGVTALVVGFVTLVARMRDEPPGDDPDNGAVV